MNHFMSFRHCLQRYRICLRSIPNRTSSTNIVLSPATGAQSDSDKRHPNWKTSREGTGADDDWNDEDLFRFTSGRFVVNENHEMSQRYVRYNAHELGRIAAKAVNAKECINIEKYPDGLYNKVLLLTMSDGVQVVAKVPNPSAGRAHLTTASEVATMEFAREVLNTPVPKIYAWSSRAHANSVDAEFIIMEKVAGLPLASVWDRMGIGDRFSVVKAIGKYQKVWTSCSFNRYGSLYYAQDLDEPMKSFTYTDQDGAKVDDPRFAVGPSVARRSNDDGRSRVDFDRGPWNTLEDYAMSVGNREMACVQGLPELPRSPLTLCGPGAYQPTKEKKLKALRCYLALVKYLLPTDQSITTSCLWHSDLHEGNIFVDPEQPTRIVSIIDWQSTALAPLFEHAHQPCLLDYNGTQIRGLERPHMPRNWAQQDKAAQKEAKVLFFKKSLSALYRTLTHKINPLLYRAMMFHEEEEQEFELLLLARSLLVDGEALYLSQVMALQSSWAELPGVCARGSPPFPIQFSTEEIASINADAERALLGMQAMNEVRKTLGELFPEKGFVRHDEYDKSLNALEEMRDQVANMFSKTQEDREAWLAAWPFGN